MGSVNITLSNGNLGGTTQTQDGIVGMVMSGTGSGSFPFGEGVLLGSVKDAEALGMTAANNPLAHRNIKSFYGEAGEGAALYVLLVSDAYDLKSMCDPDNADGISKLIDYAEGKITVIGVACNDVAVFGADGDFSKGIDAITNMQTTLANYANKQWPMRGVVAMGSYLPEGVELNELDDVTLLNKNRVSALLGDTVADLPSIGAVSSALGLLMGRIARIPVQRKVSRVKDGPITLDQVYLGYDPTSGNMIKQEQVSDVVKEALQTNGYISFKKYEGKGGYYFTGDGTATAAEDDYSMLSRGRVIDKAQRIIYRTLVDEIDEEVPTVEGGKPDPDWCLWLENKIVTNLDQQMTSAGEIVAALCNIPRDQLITQDSQLDVVGSVRPLGYSTNIDVKLGYTL